MIRRAFTAASVLSLLLCVGFAVEAVRGFSRFDALTVQTGSGSFQFTSSYGTLNFALTPCAIIDYANRNGWQSWQIQPLGRVWGWYRPDWFIVSSETRHLGIGYITGGNWSLVQSDGTARPAPAWLLTFPSWMPPLLAALLPAWWLPREWRSRRGLRRVARGECAACGYSLAGNTSGVCPECGAPIPSKTQDTPA